MRQIRLVIAALLVTSPFVANADSILTGAWVGDWAGFDATAVFDMYIDQEADGTFTGYFDWNCTSGFTCSGREEFAGFFDMTTLVIDFSTTALVPPIVNIGFGTYIGSVALDGNSMWGTDNDNLGTEWRATKVPEPGSLALIGIGLLGMGLARRLRKF